MLRMLCRWGCLALLPTLLLTGCPPEGPPANSNDPSAQNGWGAGPGSNSGAAAAGTPVLVQLDVYQLTVPFGSLSRDDQFWKRVDETQLDMPTYDLLLKNGIRVGIGDNADWQYFRTLIDKYQVTGKSASSSATDGGYLDLPLHDKIEYQDIFYFNQRSELTGRTFIKCQDLLSVAFFASKRHDGETLIKVCPVIHGLKKIFEVTEMGNELEVDDSNPEKLYDLNLQALVPANHFLIIAPSRQSRFPDLIGSAFLDGDGAANRTETVIILVPQEIKLRRLPDKALMH